MDTFSFGLNDFIYTPFPCSVILTNKVFIDSLRAAPCLTVGIVGIDRAVTLCGVRNGSNIIVLEQTIKNLKLNKDSNKLLKKIIRQRFKLSTYIYKKLSRSLFDDVDQKLLQVILAFRAVNLAIVKDFDGHILGEEVSFLIDIDWDLEKADKFIEEVERKNNVIKIEDTYKGQSVCCGSGQ